VLLAWASLLLLPALERGALRWPGALVLFGLLLLLADRPLRAAVQAPMPAGSGGRSDPVCDPLPYGRMAWAAAVWWSALPVLFLFP